MSNTIEGIWHSHYEYGQGLDNKPQVGEHKVEFIQDNEVWVGTSLPNDEGSELTITIRQNDYEFKGDWHERTSPTGSYGGREFGGTILLLLQAEGAELNGMWLGANSDQSRVKSGMWTLKREE
jgi:hypothetical protein